ncbi:polyprenyl synthetase family protein [Flavobacterium sp. DG2-3]|uniref:polyprenyl synthetase family protein n=1 Tax=Flavobacterium sp. DG2-3 TaxID=3068317 RepID=UPI003531537B
MMLLGGKRLRPVLTLIATEIFGSNFNLALPAALAIETFHNSSLIHDDIIDDDPIRRGKPTVHKKWSTNTAILSGDAMIILTYKHLEKYAPDLALQLIKAINKMALEICEGQQLDVDFESRQNVSVSEYLKMIEYKTGSLIATSLKVGAIIAQASQKNCDLIYDFGLNLGLAFQLQDDYLDIYGDTPTFGRRLYGDIISNKKTYLYLKTLELLNETDKEKLLKLFGVRLDDNTEKIKTVNKLYLASGIADITQKEIQKYTFKAFESLDKINIPESKKKLLKDLGKELMNRRI